MCVIGKYKEEEGGDEESAPEEEAPEGEEEEAPAAGKNPFA